MNFVELLVSNLLGFILGIVASFVSWWVLFKVLRPTIEFSKSISKAQSRGGYSFYRIKIANTSSRRAIDLDIVARVKLSRTGYQRNTRIVKIALNVDGETTAHRMFLRPGVENATILKLLPTKTGVFRSLSFPSYIREKARDGTLELEDILGIHPKSYLELCVFATDDFSGTRMLAVSQQYHADDIRHGYFELNSLEIADHTVLTSQPQIGEDDE